MKALSLALGSGALAFAAPLAAHDFWLDLPAYRLAGPGTVEVAPLVGEAGQGEHWELLWRKIVSVRLYGPEGVSDEQPGVAEDAPGKPGKLSVELSGPGTFVLALDSNQAESDLAPADFEAYLREEGLTAAVAERQAAGKSTSRGRELYSRRAKALIQVGSRTTAQVTRPIGQTLELVPLRNPYALRRGETLSVQVLYHGMPLPGARIALVGLDGAEAPIAAVSDREGKVAFALTGGKRWRVATVWTQPIAHPRADYETVFASLTFGS